MMIIHQRICSLDAFLPHHNLISSIFSQRRSPNIIRFVRQVGGGWVGGWDGEVVGWWEAVILARSQTNKPTKASKHAESAFRVSESSVVFPIGTAITTSSAEAVPTWTPENCWLVYLRALMAMPMCSTTAFEWTIFVHEWGFKDLSFNRNKSQFCFCKLKHTWGKRMHEPCL